MYDDLDAVKNLLQDLDSIESLDSITAEIGQINKLMFENGSPYDTALPNNINKILSSLTKLIAELKQLGSTMKDKADAETDRLDKEGRSLYNQQLELSKIKQVLTRNFEVDKEHPFDVEDKLTASQKAL